MIAHAIDRERVLACGGVNIFGDPKVDCWIMGFNPEPFWLEKLYKVSIANKKFDALFLK